MKLFWPVLSGVLCTAHISFAEPRVTYNSYGMPGLVDMPSAQSAPDAELSFSVSQSGESLRNTLTFQIAPRLTGAFRYSSIERPQGTLYDRSFDLRYRLLDETHLRPAVAAGLQDFIGTGVYSGEYVAASKTFGPVVATAGIGWGFKNAKFWSNKNHWQWAVEPNAREKASFLKENINPIEASGQLNFIDIPTGDFAQNTE